MDQLRLHYTINQQTAAIAGVSRYGEGTYEPSDADLATLNEDERRLLLYYCEPRHRDSRTVRQYLPDTDMRRPCSEVAGIYTTHGPLKLDAANVTWDAIVAGIHRDVALAERAVREREIQIEQARLAAREWLTSWLAASDEDVVSIDDGVRTCIGSSGRYSASGIAAPIGHLTDEDLRAYNHAHEARSRKLDALREARDTERAARQKTTREAILAYARGVPALARAAEEQYDVLDATIAHAASLIEGAIDEETYRALNGGGRTVTYVDGTAAFQRIDYSERRAPTTRAFAALDAVERALNKVRASIPFTVSVSRLKRITVSRRDKDCSPEVFTGIVVEVAPEWAVDGVRDRILIVPAE